jgi:calcineurin-like phosphoesterase family protein
MEYFISDTHFFHEELLTSNNFAPRPYTDLAEEHAGMIKAWNDRVADKDTVYHLGDIAMMNKIKPVTRAHELVLEILMQLNGHIVFVKGNHDSRAQIKFLEAHNPLMADGKPKFTFHDVGLIMKANHHQFFLTHYPMMFGQTPSSINLHGHIHHYMVNIPENINVGVDSLDLDYLVNDERPVWGTPLSMAEIELIIQRKHDDFAKRR